nr:25kDa protein [Novo mesto aureusvirus 1]
MLLSSVFVGLVSTITIYSILLCCIGSRYGGRVPRYVVLHWERIKKAWECGVDDDDCTAPLANVCMERVSVKLRPRLACKVAVKAISKVGLLKKSEANALVYQRVCLDVMEGMKMRWHDRLMILPQAVLACLERPDEVEEVMKAIEASCRGRFGDF